MSPLESLISTGTKLWLDSVDPDAVRTNRALGATGATSNPVIISDLIRTGRFDQELTGLIEQGLDDADIAWTVTDDLVTRAQHEFRSIHRGSMGNDGYVSFELDPLIDDASSSWTLEDRVARYVELGRRWSHGHTNRMIKVPATPAGIASLEQLVADDVTVNVTLIFSDRQYEAARDAVWRGALRRGTRQHFKSVYSIFISRIDIYTEKQVPALSAAAQGQVGIVNAKRIWQLNQQFWRDKGLPLQQEIIFASTGTKKPSDPPDKYVAALAGADIQTNPPATNAAVQGMSGRVFTRTVDEFPPQDVLAEIDDKVDYALMEQVLMEEGLQKFADPQRALLELIRQKRALLASIR
jgi:transaldolase